MRIKKECFMGFTQKNILINHFQAVEDYLKLDARNGKHLRFIELMKNRYISLMQNLFRNHSGKLFIRQTSRSFTNMRAKRYWLRSTTVNMK